MKESDDVINIRSRQSRAGLNLSSFEDRRVQQLSITVAVAHYVVGTVTVAVAVASHSEMERERSGGS